MANYSDNFNRASLGANWSGQTGGGNPSISASIRLSIPANTGARWNETGGALGNDCESEITCIAGYNAGPAVRMQSGSRSCYAIGIVYAWDDGWDWYYRVALVRVDGASFSALAWLSGDMANVNTFGTATTYKIRAVGSTIKAFAGATELASVTDSTYGSGDAGAYNLNGAGVALLDDWSGADVGGEAKTGSTALSTGATTSATGSHAGTGTTACSGAGTTFAVTGKSAATAVSGAGSVSATGVKYEAHQESDNFDRGSLGANWTKQAGAGTASIVGNQLQIAGAARVAYTAFQPGNSQSCLITALANSGNADGVCVNAGASTRGYNIRANLGNAWVLYKNDTQIGTGSGARARYNGQRLRLESINSGASVQVRLWCDEVLDIDVTDSASVITGGYPAIHVPSAGTHTFDDFVGGDYLEVKRASASVAVGGAGSISLTWRHDREAHVTAAGVTSAAGRHAGRASTGVVGYGEATVGARIQTGQLYPWFSAFGGTDPWLSRFGVSRTKGQITTPASRVIGQRVDLSPGDRVFFRVPAEQLRSGVTQARLWLTPIHIMSAQYPARADAGQQSSNPAGGHYVPPVTQPTGPLFRLYRYTGTPGTDEHLWDASGAEDGTDYWATMEAQPTWMHGQVHYDGSTRGRPIDPVPIDITDLYLDATAHARDLNVCLLGCHADPYCVVEFFGDDPENQWAKPRIEHDWRGATSVEITDADTATPLLTIVAPTGATWEATWGYDENQTPMGGPYKGHGSGEASGGAGTTAIRLPMLETAARVHVSVVMTYADTGRQTWERTWKTPKAPAPLLDLRSDSYGWEAVAGICHVNPGVVGDAYVALVKNATTHNWELWRASSGFGEFVFYKWTSAAGNPGISDPPSGPGIPPGEGQNPTANDGTGPQLNLSALSVSRPYWDPASGNLYYLSVHANAAQFDVRLNEHAAGSGDAAGVGWGASVIVDLRPATQQTLYTTTGGSQPDLAYADLSVGHDWRSMDVGMGNQPLLVAFHADGALRVRSQRTWVADAGAPSVLLFQIGTSGWAADLNQSGAFTVENRFHHAMTERGAALTLLTARLASGNCFVGVLGQDQQVAVAGGGYSNTPGTWTTRADVPNFSRAWVAQTLLRNLNAPDSTTALLMLQASNGQVTCLRALDLQTPAWGGNFMLDPGPDWYNAATFNRWMIERWPTLHSALMRTMHGGCVGLSISGTTLSAQRVLDVLKTSDTKTITVPSGAAVVATVEQAWEGEQTPAIIGASGAYRCLLVSAGMDVSRLHLPTADQRWAFKSGELEDADMVADFTSNAQADGAAVAPGPNVLVIPGWRWDPAEWRNAGGLMDWSGVMYLRLDHVQAQKVKLIVNGTSVSNGAWLPSATTGQPSWEPRSGAYSGTPELVGGEEWPMAKFDGWFYTYDPPNTPRNWRRLLEFDWHYDGETADGHVVIQTPTFTQDTVWIAHDPMGDNDAAAAEIAAAKARAPSYVTVHSGDAGELLHLVGSGAGQPVGDGALGCVVEMNLGAPRYAKEVIAISCHDDGGELASGFLVAGMLRELTSGSMRARQLLSSRVVVLYFGAGQGKVAAGIQGWAMGEGYFTPLANWVDSWRAWHPNPSACVDNAIALHCDTHGSSYRSPSEPEAVAPFFMLGHKWGFNSESIALFRQHFNASGELEMASPWAAMDGGDLWYMAEANATLAAGGGAGMYFEIPWRHPGHKAGYWWDSDALLALARAVIAGATSTSNNFWSEPIELVATGEAYAIGAKGMRVPTAVSAASGVDGVTGIHQGRNATVNTAASASTATGQHAGRGSTSLSQPGATSATGRHVSTGSTALSATAGIAVTGRKSLRVSTSISAASSLSAAGFKTARTTATIPGPGVATAVGSHACTRSPSVTGQGVTFAASVLNYSTSTAISAVSGVTAAGRHACGRSSAISAASGVTAAGYRGHRTSTALTVASGVAMAGLRTSRAVTSVTGAGATYAAPESYDFSSGTFVSAASGVVASGQKGSRVTTAISAAGEVSVTARATVPHESPTQVEGVSHTLAAGLHAALRSTAVSGVGTIAIRVLQVEILGALTARTDAGLRSRAAGATFEAAPPWSLEAKRVDAELDSRRTDRAFGTLEE